MELWDIEIQFGAGCRPLWRQCEAHDRISAPYGTYGVRMERCGGNAMRGMTWQGATEGTHNALLCDRHTIQWLGPMIQERGACDESTR